MAAQDVTASSPGPSTTSTEPSPAAVEDVAKAVANVSLQDEPVTDDKKTAETSPRPLYVYTRYELLHLSKSTMVIVPTDMPLLKDWFGCVVCNVYFISS